MYITAFQPLFDLPMLQSNRTARSFPHILYPVQVTLPLLKQPFPRHRFPSDRGSIARGQNCGCWRQSAWG